MRGALIHGVLLAVMLIYGYRTWTRDKTVKPDRGAIVLWNKAEAEIASIEYKTDKKTVLLEQRKDAAGAYWWGVDTTIDKRPKPPEKKPEPAPANAGSGSAAVAAAGSGSGAGSGSAATPPPPVAMEEVKKSTEYPVGEGGKKVLDGYFDARALRDLGVPNDKAKKDYKLDAATTTLTVAFRDNTKRTFLVGGSVFNTSGGSSDRYVMEKESGKAYVFAQLMLGSLEVGQSSLHLQDPRGFDPTKIAEVVIAGPGFPPKAIARVTAASTEGGQGQVKTWGDAATKKPNTTLANFVDNASGLRPTEYKAQLKIESLTPVSSLTYKDDRGGKLGTLSLYKLEKAGELTEGQVFDPQSPPRGETEYYIVTEKTRVPGLVRKDAGQRVEQDMPMVFSANPPAEVKKPTENPFANTPLPPREKTPPLPPGSATLSPGSAAPAGGSAAPKPPGAGSAAPAAGSAAPAAGSAAPAPAPAPAAGSAARGAHDGHGH